MYEKYISQWMSVVLLKRQTGGRRCRRAKTSGLGRLAGRHTGATAVFDPDASAASLVQLGSTTAIEVDRQLHRCAPV